jgi:hypothetical protein
VAFHVWNFKMETISVPVTLMSLTAAIEARVAALTPDSPPDGILAIIGLVETLETALDRLAMAFPDDSSIDVAA